MTSGSHTPPFLQPSYLCVGFDGVLEKLEISGVDESGLNPIVGEDVAEESVRS